MADGRGDAATRIHFIAGPPSHGWNEHEHVDGCRLLAEALRRAKLNVIATVHTNGWPARADALEGADALVLYGDGGDAHVAAGQADALRRLSEAGTGIGVLHYALMPGGEPLERALMACIGGVYDPAWSVNPIWTMTDPKLARHPVTSGVNPFALREEWYFHIRFREDGEGITPLLSALPPPEVVSERDAPHRGNPAVRQAIAER